MINYYFLAAKIQKNFVIVKIIFEFENVNEGNYKYKQSSSRYISR